MPVVPLDSSFLERAFEQPAQSFLNAHGMLDQLTVNDYSPGQGIPPHVDTHSPFEEVFVSLSLRSGACMHFKNPDGLMRDVYMLPRQLMVFSGQARYDWLHSISTRKIDKVEGRLKFRSRRVSLTFRKIKHTPCSCNYARLCDTQNTA